MLTKRGRVWSAGIMPALKACEMEVFMPEGGGTVVELSRLLEEMAALSGEVRAAGVLSKDGELLGSMLAADADRERFGSMVAALASLASRTAGEEGREDFSQVRISDEAGHVLLVRLADGGTLAATTTGPDARDGLVLYDMRNARREIERVLAGESAGSNGEGG